MFNPVELRKNEVESLLEQHQSDSPEGFVVAVYNIFLGKAPDAMSLSRWCVCAERDRRQAIIGILNSPEYLQTSGYFLSLLGYADELVKQKNWQLAEKALIIVNEHCNNSAEIYKKIGLCCWKQNKFEIALDYYYKAYQVLPNDVNVLLALAQLLIILRKDEQALQLLANNKLSLESTRPLPVTAVEDKHKEESGNAEVSNPLDKSVKEDARPKFWMNIELPDGSFTQGPSDYTKHPEYLGLSSVPLSGKRVLDIAANDGFWAFWAEKNGATETLAIDVEDYRHYDWGFDGPPQSLKNSAPEKQKNEGFWYLHRLFQSGVKRESISVYELNPDIHGVFDLVFMCGLLYHLRHPLLALDTVRRVCQGALILTTHVVNNQPMLPMSLFYLDDVFCGITNWTGATESMVAHWLRSAGFPFVYVERNRSNPFHDRQKFVACCDQKWSENFQGNQNFQFCDDNYFARSRLALEKELGIAPK